MMVDDIKKSILQEAYSGKLTRQSKDDCSFKNNNLLNLNSITKKGKFIFDESYLYKIPESWIWIKLDNIITILGDGLHGTPEYDERGEYFFVNGNNLKDGQIILKQDTKRVSKNEYNKYKKNLNCNTMFISINGTIGNIGFYNNEKIILGKSACYFNLLDYVNKKYLYYFFKSKWALDYMINNATGTTIKNVSLDVMRNIRIPFAPLEEQQRIVDKIESLFTKLDEIKPIEEKLKQLKSKFPMDMKKSILKSAIEGTLTIQSKNETSVDLVNEALQKKNLAVKNKESKITYNREKIIELQFKIPENWSKVCIGMISDISSGGTPARSNNNYWDGNIPWIKIGDLNQKYISECSEYITEDGLNNSSAKWFEPGTVLYTIFATIGTVGILNVRATTNQAIAGIKLYGSINVEYFYYVCLALKDVLVSEGRGCAQLNINQEILSNVEIPIPPLEEQQRIVDKLEQLLPLCEDIDKLLV